MLVVRCSTCSSQLSTYFSFFNPNVIPRIRRSTSRIAWFGENHTCSSRITPGRIHSAVSADAEPEDAFPLAGRDFARGGAVAARLLALAFAAGVGGWDEAGPDAAFGGVTSWSLALVAAGVFAGATGFAGAAAADLAA